MTDVICSCDTRGDLWSIGIGTYAIRFKQRQCQLIRQLSAKQKNSPSSERSLPHTKAWGPEGGLNFSSCAGSFSGHRGVCTVMYSGPEPSNFKTISGQLFVVEVLCVCVLVTQLCLTLCHPMDCTLPGSSVHGILQATTLEQVSIPFSRGIFPTQGLNPGVLHCRRIPYHLRHQTSPRDPYNQS